MLVKLFAHRFRGGNGLGGHNFGNLFVAALTEITGDFAHAIQVASKILATRGRIYPITTANATLVARMDDGSIVRGETEHHRQSIAALPNFHARPARCRARTRDAGRPSGALTLITIGPGSLYTSLITNLLVQGIPQAIADARGIRVFICNLMTQANESLGLTASEHIVAHLRAHPRTDLRLCDRQHRSVFGRNVSAVCG